MDQKLGLHYGGKVGPTSIFRNTTVVDEKQATIGDWTLTSP